MSRIATGLPYTELEVATGNYDETRKPIDRIIIHTMVGSWQGAAARFDDPSSQVSAHYGVKLDGGLIHWLEETFTAYHAGDYTMNQRSIGIEHEDGGDYNGVRPDVLYASSAKLVRDICQFYNIPIDRQHILKHSEVIATGCPDALDIDRIVREASQVTTEPMATLPQKELDQIRADRDKNWNDLQSTNQTIDSLNGIIKDKNSQISTLNGQVSDLTTQVTTKQQTIDSLQTQANKVPNLIEELSQCNNSKTLALEAQASQNKQIGQLKLTSYLTVSTKTLLKELTKRILKVG